MVLVAAIAHNAKAERIIATGLGGVSDKIQSYFQNRCTKKKEQTPMERATLSTSCAAWVSAVFNFLRSSSLEPDLPNRQRSCEGLSRSGLTSKHKSEKRK
jgi:hypothetical protein